MAKDLLLPGSILSLHRSAVEKLLKAGNGDAALLYLALRRFGRGVTPEELEKVQKFYGELLGLPLVRSWGEPKVEGLMYGAGTSLIEIFPNAEENLPQGAIRHFALATDDVDSIVETVRKAGYAVTMEPVDIEIMSKPSLPARIAFIIGPVGEEIELFCEKQ